MLDPTPVSSSDDSSTSQSTLSPHGNARGSFRLSRAHSSLENISHVIDELNINDTKYPRIGYYRYKSLVGELCEEDLERIGELGTGNGCTVFKVLHTPTQLTMVCKIIHLEVKIATLKNILRELELLHECTHPHIVNYYGSFIYDREINICREYMDVGSLDLILIKAGRIPEAIVGKIAVAVLKALSYLREKHSIMHRDVKPSNILLNSLGEIKICDFGASMQLIDSIPNSFVGTRSYMAPERLRGTHYSIQADLWSLGLSLIEIATGIFPIPPLDAKIMENILDSVVETRSDVVVEPRNIPIFELLDSIVNEPPPKLEHRLFSTEFRDFIDRCMKKEPDERPDLKTLLNHPWILKSDAEHVEIADWVCTKMNIQPPSANINGNASN